MKIDKSLNVFYKGELVGTLAMADYRVAFEYADSLPDAWGNVLLNRVLKKNGIKAEDITPLTRLAIVGRSGMGALTYEPEKNLEQGLVSTDLDELAITTVAGEGAKPQEKDLLQVGLQAGLGKVKCQKMISEIREIVGEMLVEYI